MRATRSPEGLTSRRAQGTKAIAALVLGLGSFPTVGLTSFAAIAVAIRVFIEAPLEATWQRRSAGFAIATSVIAIVFVTLVFLGAESHDPASLGLVWLLLLLIAIIVAAVAGLLAWWFPRADPSD
jgi:hypothetical protein